MIRINLLPIRAARKREYVKQQLILAVVLVAGTVVGLTMWYLAMSKSISTKKKDVQEIQQKIKVLQKQIGQVEKYKELKAKLNKKKEIIRNLEKGKTGPVKVLDRLTQIIPDEVWLTSWEEKGGIVSLEGESLSHEHVARFMRDLKDRGVWEQIPQQVNPEQDSAPTPDTPVPGEPGDQPPTSSNRLFSNVVLVDSKVVEDKETNQTFYLFKIKLKVNYAI